MELMKIGLEWVLPLKVFLDGLADSEGQDFFSPHAADENTLRTIATHTGQDFYLLLVDGRQVLGYGMLRGWDEGYSIPSLGIALHPLVRGSGFARALMDFLHAEARHRGSSKVRLRVHVQNRRAIALYTSLGYTLMRDEKQDQFLLGFKELARVAT